MDRHDEDTLANAARLAAHTPVDFDPAPEWQHASALALVAIAETLRDIHAELVAQRITRESGGRERDKPDHAAPAPAEDTGLDVDGIRFDDAQSRDRYLALKRLPRDQILHLASTDGHRLKARGDAVYLSVAGSATNPRWLTARAADIALGEGWITEAEHDDLTR